MLDLRTESKQEPVQDTTSAANFVLIHTYIHTYLTLSLVALQMRQNHLECSVKLQRKDRSRAPGWKSLFL